MALVGCRVVFLVVVLDLGLRHRVQPVMTPHLGRDVFQVAAVLVEDGGGRASRGRAARPVLGPAAELGGGLTERAVGHAARVLVEAEVGRDVLVHRSRHELPVAAILRQRELWT